MSSNSVATRLSDFINHSYDYRPNWTPLSPIAIKNIASTLCCMESFEASAMEEFSSYKRRFFQNHNNFWGFKSTTPVVPLKIPVFSKR